MWSTLVLLLAITNCLCEDGDSLRVKVVDLTNSTSAPGTRIIGGVATTIERYPYAVQIFQGNDLACGGSLLTVLHVLSAAHCFLTPNLQVIPESNYRLRLGATRLNSGGTTRNVRKIITHPRYNTPLRDNDVAVVVMSRRVSLSRSIDRAAIPRQGDVTPDNAYVVHVGWGRTHPQVNLASEILQEVSVRKVNNFVCQQRYNVLEVQLRQPFPVTPSMMCAGLLDVGGADACQGDSGGPLIYNNVVVGVTSWGYGCAEPFVPGVSARVSSFTNWIVETVDKNGVAGRGASGTITVVAIITALCSLVMQTQ